jgi:hypothetical protein
VTLSAASRAGPDTWPACGRPSSPLDPVGVTRRARDSG